MKTKIILNSLFGLVIGLILFVPGSLAAAFGVAPPWIINDNLKPGSNFVYVIDLNTNDPAMDMWVKSEIKGSPEVLQWVKIRDKENLSMPAGQQHVPMYVEVNIPSDAKVGKYKGDIGVTVMPKNVERQDVSIFLGAHIAVELTVTNRDITDYWVKSVSIDPITLGQPLTLNLEVKNLGNTVLSAIKTKVDISDKDGKVVTSAVGDNLTKQIYPQTVDAAKISIPVTGLAAGNFWVDVMVYKDAKVIYQNKLYLPVTVVELNNVLKTSVNVGNEEEFKAAAGNEIVVPTPFAPPIQQMNGVGNNVKVKTTVTVRAPLTNQLIGVVIILLGILIVVTARLEIGLFKKLGHKHHHHH